MLKKSCLGLVLIGLVACGGEDAAPGADAAMRAPAAPREVHFTASDFAFEGPETIEAGMLTLVLHNSAETWHHLQLVRLPDGMSMQEFEQGMASMQPGTPPPPWFMDAGGVNPPPPGEPARVTMLVEPGEYAVLCLVDTPDKIPHVMKGMIRPLTVTASSEPPAPLPPSDLTLTLVDYAFSFSAPPTSATRVIRVENGATQAHEIAIFRLLPGKTMDDLGAWAATYEGPAPMTPVGGVPAIRPGQVADVYVDLEPGAYVALCFLPDATDGLPHLDHGMALPFQVS
ncbi:MAG: hypothetical protein OEO79_14155 [Gemmatimonadota bacterium]|nr:hypothetical protein [Gemmatimonadota bacterium]MDH3424120.1 hypothetical protein [Gemmatimonadota bacterium]